MNRALLLLAAVVAVIAVACGGTPDTGHKVNDESAATLTAAPGDSRASTADHEPRRAGRSVSSLLGPLLNLGVGGATSGAPSSLPGVRAGGGDLEQYLLTADEIPDGFEPTGTYSFKLPAGAAPDFPGGEIAASMWTSGELQSAEAPTGGSMLMVMVMLPDDPSMIEELSGELDAFDADQIEQAFGGDGSLMGVEIKDVEELDTTGLGDNAAGIGLTMDMSGFFENLIEGFGGDLSGGEMPTEMLGALSAFQMRIRFFGEGDKLGMVMQIGFGEDAELADDLEVAQTLRAKLQ